MEVVLIRHTSVDVPKGTCYGWTDVPVAQTFDTEAAETKRNLGETPFDAVYSSPLTRARKLAAYCGYPVPVLDSRLKEMHMGDWEMRRFDDINDENLQKYYDDFIHTPTTNGESFTQFYGRVSSFLDDLKDKGLNRVAIFAHGGVLMCAGIYAGLYTEETCFQYNPPYGGILRINI